MGNLAPASNDPMRLQVDLLREQLSRQQEMMLHLIDRPQPAAAAAGPGGSLLQLVQAVGALRELASPQSQIQGVIDALSEGMKIGMKQNAPASADDKFSSVLKIIDRVGEIVPRVMAAPAAPATAPGAAPAPAPAASADTDAERKEMLKQMVGYLKARAVGRDPGVWADWIIENLDARTYSMLAALLQKPYDDIVAEIGDDELKREPFLTWFKNLVIELRNGFTNPDTERAGGNSGRPE